jgi:hypothetical protein
MDRRRHITSNALRSHLPPGRRGTRQRGAALLEGVVVCAACLGLLALGLAVHEREVARLERERDGRTSTWQRALAGCTPPDRIAGLARAALRGGATSAAERLARDVHVLAVAGDARRPRVPCNEPAAGDVAEWSRVEMDLERQLLPVVP